MGFRIIVIQCLYKCISFFSRKFLCVFYFLRNPAVIKLGALNRFLLKIVIKDNGSIDRFILFV